MTTDSTQDLEHLKILSIFHYVVAALAALGACFPVLHLAMGIGMVSGKWGQAGQDPMESYAGWFFIVFAAVLILAGWAFAIGLFLAGRFLAQRKHYTYCLVMAAFACMFMPFGTVLGVFTILVLIRESVKELFGKASDPLPAGGQP